MINVYIIRKFAALIIPALLTVIGFFIGLQFYGLLWALLIMVIMILLGVFLGALMLKNPFTSMLEGKGLLVFNVDSTGVINPFIMGLKQPYIAGKVAGKQKEDIFNRATVMQVANPNKVKANATPTKEGGLKLELTEEMLNHARFALNQYPVLIWNNQLKSFLTKESISQLENDTMAEHGLLYIVEKMKELTSTVRDFARYVVEQQKPQSSIFQSKWFWIIIVIVAIIILALFAGPLIQAFLTGMGGASEAAKGVELGAVIPK